MEIQRQGSEQPSGRLEALSRELKQSVMPFCWTMALGFAAHMFMLTNKIPVEGDSDALFEKGATVVSGRYGLNLISYIMPDISMPWIYGLMSLLLISIAVCIMIRLFDIKSKPLQILLGGLIICSPAEAATLCYMFTCAPYALAMLLAVCAVYVFDRGYRFKWLFGPLLLILSCCIYQGYFGFAASFCLIILIRELLEDEKTTGEVLRHGAELLAMLAASAVIYALSAFAVGKLCAIPVLDIINKDQSIPMRIAVAYSAYLKTFFKGYFAYVNCSVSLGMHLLLIVMAAAVVLMRLKGRGFARAALLFLLIALFPLSCYCIYLAADNGYIHSLALYPFAAVYVLFIVIVENFASDKHGMTRTVAAAAMAVIVLCNVYFDNSLYLCSYLQYESRMSYYTAMMTEVMQTEGFEEGTELALIGERAELNYDLEQNFDFSGFQTPGFNIADRVHSESLIRYYLGLDIPFASEETMDSIEQTEEFQAMPIYPYHGSVKEINGCIVVKLGG